MPKTLTVSDVEVLRVYVDFSTPNPLVQVIFKEVYVDELGNEFRSDEQTYYVTLDDDFKFTDYLPLMTTDGTVHKTSDDKYAVVKEIVRDHLSDVKAVLEEKIKSERGIR